MTEMDSDSVEVTPPHAVGVTQSFDAGDQPFNHAVPSVSDLTPVCRHTSSPHVAHHVHDSIKPGDYDTLSDSGRTSIAESAMSVDPAAVSRTVETTSSITSPTTCQHQSSPSSSATEHRVSTNPRTEKTSAKRADGNSSKAPSPTLACTDIEKRETSESSAAPAVKSDCCDTGCQSPTSSEVIHHQEKDEEQEAQKNLSLTTQRLFSLPVDLPRRTGELLGGDFEVTTKLPLTLKLNGFVTQLDEGPLDLSLGRRRDSAGGARSSRRSDRKQPEALSTDSRLRSCTKSQAASLTSASLAKLVKRFGGALTSNSALETTHSLKPRSVAVHSQSGPSLLSPPLPLLLSSTIPAVNLHLTASTTTTTTSTSTFCSPLPPPPPSRWRRDSFWANGGWLQAAAAGSANVAAPTSPLVAGHRSDIRKRPAAATLSDVSVDRNPSHVTAEIPPQSAVNHLNQQRKQQPPPLPLSSSDHQHTRKSSQQQQRGSSKSSLRRHDRKLSSSFSGGGGSHLDSSSSRGGATSKTSSRPEMTTDGGAETSVPKTPTSPPKLPRRTTPAAEASETLADTAPAPQNKSEKKQERQDADEVTATVTGTPSPVIPPARGNLTSLRCGSCGSQYDSLYSLTVHLEETGHHPASDVAVLPQPAPRPSPATSPSSSDHHRRTVVVASPPPVATATAPQRLVRGQDVWLARGVEQTDRILRCIQCNAPARSLAELTLHMVHTKHYINIVGPPTTNSPAVQPTSRDKPADTTTSTPALRTTRNGLRLAAAGSSSCCKNHALTNTKISNCRDGYGCAASFSNDHKTLLEQKSTIFLPGSATRGDDARETSAAGTDEEANPNVRLADYTELSPPNICGVQKRDGKRQATTDRSAAFCVRNLIAASSLPLTTTTSSLTSSPSLTSRRRRDVVAVSSATVGGQEVTSSSDERPSPAAAVKSRLPSETAAFEHDVVSA